MFKNIFLVLLVPLILLFTQACGDSQAKDTCNMGNVSISSPTSDDTYITGFDSIVLKGRAPIKSNLDYCSPDCRGPYRDVPVTWYNEATDSQRTATSYIIGVPVSWLYNAYYHNWYTSTINLVEGDNRIEVYAHHLRKLVGMDCITVTYQTP